jgi:tetratricopeptide (TPR) repeat protein
VGQGKLDEARAVLERRPVRTTSGDTRSVQLAIFSKDYNKASVDVTTVPQEARYFFEGMIALGRGEPAKAKSCFEDARRYFEKQLPYNPNEPVLLNSLSIADAGAGRKEEALRQARLLIELVPMSKDAVDGIMYANELAQICAWVGEEESALEQLPTLVKLPGGPNYGQLRFDPVWESVRKSPRFQEIMERAAQPPEYD